MTSKDYQMVAEVVREVPITGTIGSYGTAEVVREQMAEALAKRFKQDNPRFNKDKFLMACDVAM